MRFIVLLIMQVYCTIDQTSSRLSLIHLISIPVTNTSVNPARSTATALFVGDWAVRQLWLFWLAPMIGAAIAGFAYKPVFEGPVEEPPVTGRAKSVVHA